MAFRNAFYYDHRRNLTCVLDPQNGLTYYTYDATGQTALRQPQRQGTMDGVSWVRDDPS